MKLLIFIYSLHCGGAERVTANLANHWAAKGWQVILVTLDSTAKDFYSLHPAVQRVALNMAEGSSGALQAIANNLLRTRALRKVIKTAQPRVALAMMSTSSVLLALATMGMQGVVTVGAERIHPPRIALGRAWEAMRARLYGRLNAVVALTAESAAWLREHTRARRILIIPNTAPWPLVTQPPHLPVPARGDRQRILLTVGRLDYQKGFDLLVEAFQYLTGDFPEWNLVILGEGPRRDALEQQARCAGIANRVSLPGRAGNIGEWYAAADVYVMSSRFEGFPNALVEAMAHGLPVVSFDCETGPRDIVRSEVDGLLVPANNVTALAIALRRLMGDEVLRQRFGAAAIAVRDRFSPESVAAMWESLFEGLQNGG